MNRKYKLAIIVVILVCFIPTPLFFACYKYQVYRARQEAKLIVIGDKKNTEGISDINTNNIDTVDTINTVNNVDTVNDIENVSNTTTIVACETNIIGKLTIPDILLKDVQIKEGTSPDILNDAIGHFPNTSNYIGNIGLASHNSGRKGDYFRLLKNIKIGSQIYYETDYGTKKYIVKTKTIISETDFSYLQNTKDNRITLITCVSGNKDKRLCVQAVEEL